MGWHVQLFIVFKGEIKLGNFHYMYVWWQDCEIVVMPCGNPKVPNCSFTNSLKKAHWNARN
jgi:hypothetical protein